MDLRVNHRGHPDGIQDALSRVEVNLLYAKEACIQGISSNQSVGPSEPGAAVGPRIGGDLLQPPQPPLVRPQGGQAQVAGAVCLRQHHRLSLHGSAPSGLLHAPGHLLTHRKIHNARDKHFREPLLHRAVPVHLHHGDPGAEVERGEHRGVVEERAVLGDWRHISASICGHPGALEGAGGDRHQLHGHV